MHTAYFFLNFHKIKHIILLTLKICVIIILILLYLPSNIMILSLYERIIKYKYYKHIS
jgi:hypothetical protein